MNNLRTHPITTRPRWRLALFAVLVAINLSPGCVELGIITPIGNGGTGDGAADPTPADDDPEPLSARLTVSNPTPQLSEEVRLNCRAVSGDDTGAVFDFNVSQPPATGLSINRNTGVATFIVTESDLNVSFRFTCTVATDTAQSPASSAQLVTPTGS